MAQPTHPTWADARRRAAEALRALLLFLQEDHGPQLRQAVGQVAAFCVLCFCGAEAFGTAVHELNDRIAAWASRRHQPTPQPTPQPLRFAVIDFEEGVPLTAWTTAHDAAADAEAMRPGWQQHERYWLLSSEEWDELNSPVPNTINA